MLIEAAANTLHASQYDGIGAVSGGTTSDPTFKGVEDLEKAKAEHGEQLSAVYDQMAEIHNQISEVDAVVRTLPDTHWKVIYCKYQRKMSLSALARTLGAKSKGAAEKRVQRAVKAFSKAWDARQK